MNIEEHAQKRRDEWLQEHGSHEWEKHNLLEEALEEVADAYNYIVEAFVPATQVQRYHQSVAYHHLLNAYNQVDCIIREKEEEK